MHKRKKRLCRPPNQHFNYVTRSITSHRIFHTIYISFWAWTSFRVTGLSYAAPAFPATTEGARQTPQHVEEWRCSTKLLKIADEMVPRSGKHYSPTTNAPTLCRYRSNLNDTPHFMCEPITQLSFAVCAVCQPAAAGSLFIDGSWYCLHRTHFPLHNTFYQKRSQT